MMTPERRAEIEAMLNAITGHDWFWNDSANLERLMTYTEQGATAILAHDNESYVGAIQQADMDFIARAPDIVRGLLTDLDRLTSALSNLPGAMEAVRASGGHDTVYIVSADDYEELQRLREQQS